MTMRIMTILIACALFLSAPCLRGPRANATNSQKCEDSVPPPGTVEITFDGLMLFHKNGNHYEVGIVDAHAAPAPHHEFSITGASNGKPWPQPIDVNGLKHLGNAWVLEVENRKTAVDVTPTPCRRKDRFDPDHDRDFCWIIDIESEEFHGKKLELKPGKLKPIIQISNGELFTKLKSNTLKRKRGLGGYKEFGFVADKTGLCLTLQGNENLVLKVVGAGGRGLAFSLPSTMYHTVEIKNVYPRPMEEAKEPEHFQYYYELFDNVGWLRKFGFKDYKGMLMSSSREKAKDYSKSSDRSSKCCPYICGQLLMGQMDHPLW